MVLDRIGKKATIQAQISSDSVDVVDPDDDQRRDRHDRRHLQDDGVGKEATARSSATARTAPRAAPPTTTAAASAARVMRERDQQRAEQACPSRRPGVCSDQERAGQDVGRDAARSRTDASHRRRASTHAEDRPGAARPVARARRPAPHRRRHRPRRACAERLPAAGCVVAPRCGRPSLARIGRVDRRARRRRGPGRAAITTMRCDRKTDSKTRWVTKTTVTPVRCHSAEQIVVRACGA